MVHDVVGRGRRRRRRRRRNKVHDVVVDVRKKVLKKVRPPSKEYQEGG